MHSLTTTGTPTIWLRRFAAPRPVGPAPITSTSTSLQYQSVEVFAVEGLGKLTCSTCWKLRIGDTQYFVLLTESSSLRRRSEQVKECAAVTQEKSVLGAECNE
jgi:hypothetical protein